MADHGHTEDHFDLLSKIYFALDQSYVFRAHNSSQISYSNGSKWFFHENPFTDRLSAKNSPKNSKWIIFFHVWLHWRNKVDF